MCASQDHDKNETAHSNMTVLLLGGIPPVPRLVFQTGMNEKHCMHVMTGGTAARTRRRQGQGRFENGVLINQEGLAARSTKHTGIDMRNLGVACIRKECHGDLPGPVKIQYNIVKKLK